MSIAGYVILSIFMCWMVIYGLDQSLENLINAKRPMRHRIDFHRIRRDNLLRSIDLATSLIFGLVVYLFLRGVMIKITILLVIVVVVLLLLHYFRFNKLIL